MKLETESKLESRTEKLVILAVLLKSAGLSPKPYTPQGDECVEFGGKRRTGRRR